MTTTKAIAITAPRLPIATSDPACEDELDVTDVGRMMVVVVMLEELIVVAVVLEELIVVAVVLEEPIVSLNIMDV
jgi:predicted ATPase